MYKCGADQAKLRRAGQVSQVCILWSAHVLRYPEEKIQDPQALRKDSSAHPSCLSDAVHDAVQYPSGEGGGAGRADSGSAMSGPEKYKGIKNANQACISARTI